MHVLGAVLAMVIGCNGKSPPSSSPPVSTEASGSAEGTKPPMPSDLAFRMLDRSFGTFDVPDGNGWEVRQDGWPPPPPACRDESYRRAHPAACAPLVGNADARFEMVRVLPGKAPLSLFVQAYPTAALAETLLADDIGRAHNGTHQVTTIAGAKALVVRREHADIGHYEESVTTYSKQLMVVWKIGGPLSEKPTIRAIGDRLIDTIALKP